MSRNRQIRLNIKIQVGKRGGEREREIEPCIWIRVCIYIYIYTHQITGIPYTQMDMK